MPHDILIFSDRPASTGSLNVSMRAAFTAANYNIRAIYQDDIKNGVLRHPDSRMLVLPGITGEDNHYPVQIDKAALDEIHRFVSNDKNVLLAICAGAYFICRETLYTPAWGDKKTEQSRRPLFNALAHGPVLPHGIQPGPHNHYCDIGVIPVRYKGRDGIWHITSICYGNGPGLYPDVQNNPDTEILAIYDAAPNQPAALIRHRVGAGVVYLCSIHPEIGYQKIRPDPGLEHIVTLMADLKPHEAGRLAVWDDLTSRIKLDLS